MKKTALLLLGLTATCFFSATAVVAQRSQNSGTTQNEITNNPNENKMKLGAFSLSLSVKDLKASKEFYENLGFTTFGGGRMEKNYLIMKNGNTLIGLFNGMFEGNMLTFNPGWDENAKNFDPFDDVRDIQKQLKSKGIAIAPEADEKTTGPAYIMTKDPDGNVILIDQHR